MSTGVCQSEYRSSKEVALSWWRSLPDNVVVSGFKNDREPCDANQSCPHSSDGSFGWNVWFADNAKNKLLVGAAPDKQSNENWKIEIHWWKSVKPIAEIVERTLISQGAVCTWFQIVGRK